MEIAKRMWVAKNPGVYGLISKETKVSTAFVHAVLYNKRKSSNGAVERALKRRQAPGIL